MLRKTAAAVAVPTVSKLRMAAAEAAPTVLKLRMAAAEAAQTVSKLRMAVAEAVPTVMKLIMAAIVSGPTVTKLPKLKTVLQFLALLIIIPRQMLTEIMMLMNLVTLPESGSQRKV